ncbi:hypothetical protein B0T14DRAFT_566425 [Immersiella caudata]|uniref:Uncharacterized protein n=1 Tax=Immersiella caudata TaxID=314043 RepID=A0AA39WQ97_9PEZI|nr:hypothetical protein B0T14DRAFT_566425 [Immersiella caudata]
MEDREEEGQKLMSHPAIKKSRKIIFSVACMVLDLLAVCTIVNLLLGADDGRGLVPRTPVTIAAWILNPDTIIWPIGMASAALVPLTLSSTGPGDHRPLVLELLTYAVSALTAVQAMKISVATFENSEHDTIVNTIIAATLLVLDWVMRLVHLGSSRLGFGLSSYSLMAVGALAVATVGLSYVV